MKKCAKCKVKKEFNCFGKSKNRKDGLTEYCRYCKKENNKKYYQDNKNKARQYYENNKEKIKELRKEYNKNNKEKVNKYRVIRCKTDYLFKLKKNLSTRTWQAFKFKGYSKDTKTQKMLGTDWKVCELHIKQQFTKYMDWDNYGDWHIDHIVPLSCADTEKELKLLCHYTNLQPLLAVDNLAKSNTYIKAINYNKVLNKHPEPEILKAIVNRSQIVILQ